MGKINAGVTLMQDFCRPNSDVFASYIDYIAREEAQRNNAIQTFNLFNDYMGNPEKSTGLFTAEKDALTPSEKYDLKQVFETAQENGSVMWQTVISFDNLWLEKNGLYHVEQKILDERKMKEVTRIAMNRLLKSEELEHAVWSAGIHYNTDNIHVHIAIVEPYPMRQKILYEGKLETKGRFKYSSIEKCKSAVVNEIMQTKEINQRINFIIRKDFVESLKARELSEDPVLQDKFLKLCQDIPNVSGNLIHYNNRAMGSVRKQVDEISTLFLDKYCPEKYQEFLQIVEHQSSLYAEAYGGGNAYAYKDDKKNDLMERMGNAVLKSAKNYMGNLEKYETPIISRTEIYTEPDPESIENAGASVGENFSDWELPENEIGNNSEQETQEVKNLSSVVTEEENTFDLHLPKEKQVKKELTDERLIKELEQAEEVLYAVNEDKEKKTTGSGGIEDKYRKWFSFFKEKREEVHAALCESNGESVEQLVDELQQSARENPFIKCLLGEMYLYGKLTEIDQEKAQQYFKEALDIFESDVNHFPGPEKGKFDFKSYLQYRIGKQYVRGWGTDYDPEIAAEWFDLSETDYAKYSLGNLYYEGEGVEQDYEKALLLYEDTKNNPFADLKCAEMYEKGLGAEQDIKKSEEYYKKAYERFCKAEEKQQDALFEYQIGNMLYQGKGCEQDIDQAIKYLDQAAKQKNIPAILLLSNIYTEQKTAEPMPDLIDELEKLSEKGNHEAAQYTLGKIYTSEWEFYDLEKGVEQYKKAAEQGNEYAQYQLGKLYINPELEIYDLEKGIEYLEASAEQGNQYAQYQLGKLYINRELEVYDLEKGIKYLESSREQGNEAAQYLLGVQYLDKTSKAYSPEKGLEYLNQLAEKGHEYAQVKLGFEYIKGEHVEKNLFIAREWFGRAAEQGNELAKEMVVNMTASPMSAVKHSPLGEFDKALMELRKSMYEAQKETQKNLLLYEQEIEEEMYLWSL